ncbi:MAG TPA: ribosome-associated translation inhibitor RaiA [Melioribacteraceae bacterium]|nr:ribosome-associated translation inhibitor RaiA [Melioribacteraceae bacterium]
MNIQITSRKFRAKDSLKDFINNEVSSLEKYNDEILEANVILSFTHLKESEKTSEIVIKIPGKTLSVSETTDEFEKSITLAVEKLVRQLRKVKTKKLASIR